jgi:hypothetical protein
MSPSGESEAPSFQAEPFLLSALQALFFTPQQIILIGNRFSLQQLNKTYHAKN